MAIAQTAQRSTEATREIRRVAVEQQTSLNGVSGQAKTIGVGVTLGGLFGMVAGPFGTICVFRSGFISPCTGAVAGAAAGAYTAQKLNEFAHDPVAEAYRFENSKRWRPDDDVGVCANCEAPFHALLRKHHCRRCGEVFCATCTSNTAVVFEPAVPQFTAPVRVCDDCFHHLTH